MVLVVMFLSIEGGRLLERSLGTRHLLVYQVVFLDHYSFVINSL
jgi:hypothetical protein